MFEDPSILSSIGFYHSPSCSPIIVFTFPFILLLPIAVDLYQIKLIDIFLLFGSTV